MKKRFFIQITVLLWGFVFFSCATRVPIEDGENLLPNLDYTPVTPQSSLFTITYAAKYIPSKLQKSEKKLLTRPQDSRLLLEAGSFYVMYANAFIQHNAQFLPPEQYDRQNAELLRAKAFYLRGRDLALRSLEATYPGFEKALLSGNPESISGALKNLDKSHVDTMYWAGAGWLGAFSLEPLDPNLISTVSGAVLMLEKAVDLDPTYSDGALLDILCAYYAAAPGELGGSKEKALEAHKAVMEITGGKTIGPYITYATSICMPASDLEGFEKALNSALAIKPRGSITDKLAAEIALERAKWLADHKEDFFLVW